MVAGLTDAGMVSYWDEAVGNITAAYKEKGMWENTLMVLTTEYAKPFPQKVFWKSTWCVTKGGLVVQQWRADVLG